MNEEVRYGEVSLEEHRKAATVDFGVRRKAGTGASEAHRTRGTQKTKTASRRADGCILMWGWEAKTEIPVYFIKNLFACRDPPPVPDWMRLPSLSIAVFGESKRTPDLERVRRVYRDLLAKVFPDELAAKRVAIEREYDRLASEKLEIKDVPARSEMGHAPFNGAKRFPTNHRQLDETSSVI